MPYIEFNNATQPAINDTNLNRMQDLIHQDVMGAVSGDTLPIGTIVPFGSDTIPENWLLCNGQEVSRTDYVDLFNNIGTKFGIGDGFTTFNLPDLNGKVLTGKDENDIDFNELGKTGGEKEHTLTVSEMPEHEHTYGVSDTTGGQTQNQPGYGGTNNIDQSTSKTGGSQPHNNLQPYIVSNFIIKAKQSAGLVATVVDDLESESEIDALSAKQGGVLDKKITGTVLFENVNGDNGSEITLNDSISNYKEVKVDYVVALGEYKMNESKRVSIIDGNCISLSCHMAHSEALQLLDIGRYLFSGTTLTRVYETRSRIAGGASLGWDGTSTGIYITKVTGYNV